MAAIVNFQDVEDAFERIKNLVHLTPCLTSRTLDKMADENSGNPNASYKLNFKCENLQKTGSFKARGACNAVLQLKAKGHRGVITHSSGNHGQAVAYACMVAGIKCKVVVPKETPEVKKEAIKGYKSSLIECDHPTLRVVTCQKVAEESGFPILHPYDDPKIIAGQATAAYEMMKFQGLDDVDAIITTISGGGLASGLAIAAKSINPDVKVILVTPEGKNLEECLKSGKRQWPNPPQFLNTIAEGIKTQQVGRLTFPILCEKAEHEVIVVTDQEMINAMKVVAERMKMVVEASAAAAVAACIYHAREISEKWPMVQKMAIILCGGNTDVSNLPF